MSEDKFFLPKTEWGPGLWQEEPDELTWKDFSTGYSCYIWRHPRYGALNGYVRVGTKNKLYGKSYDAVYKISEGICPHGGLTFAGRFEEKTGKTGWWFGFDANHAGDLAPGMAAWHRKLHEKTGLTCFDPDRGDQYRNLSYIWLECTELAMQLSYFERAKK